jgi:hypothetical protein
MIVDEELYAIAVALGKSENMRTTAGQKFATLWEYVRSPDTDGAQQVIDAGQEPTQEGLWEMLIKQKAFPKMLGTSFRTGRRLMRIGRAPDPAAADATERETKRMERCAAGLLCYTTDLRRPGM